MWSVQPEKGLHKVQHTANVRVPFLAMRCVLPFIACLVVGCSNIEEAAPRPRPSSSASRPSFEIDVVPIMRGTVASEAILQGFDSVVVRGYGIVVGLAGTGSKVMPAEVRALLIRELTRREISDPVNGLDISPERFLDSDNIAAVVVEGTVPPGASRNTAFDVRVFVVPGSGTTSLEGGKLWTTELRAGVLSVGNRQPNVVAEAKGPLIINPFSGTSAAARSDIDLMSGRVLNGGRVLKDIPMRLRLGTPSHSRAGTIVSAINTQFPRERNQRDDTARGRNDDVIELCVPPSYQGKTTGFAQLVQHTSLDPQNTEALAAAVRRSLLANPGVAEAASWRWQALGKKSIPMFQDLYTHPEEQPRMAALEAGAKLGDPVAIAPLLKMAQSGTPKIRLAAIKLLGNMDSDATVDVGLRPLLNDPDLDVRLTAYDMLLKRLDLSIERTNVNGRFELNVVPSTIPMVYAAQTGAPRIAIFGSDLMLKRPLTDSIWDGRLILKAEGGDDHVLVFYRSPTSERGRVEKVSADLATFVAFLGTTPTPNTGNPGLDLRYGECLSVLQRLCASGTIPAPFRAEQDRILAEIMRSEDEAQDHKERPEFPTEPVAGVSPSLAPTPSTKPPPPALDGKAKSADTVPR